MGSTGTEQTAQLNTAPKQPNTGSKQDVNSLRGRLGGEALGDLMSTWGGQPSLQNTVQSTLEPWGKL